MSTDSRLVWLDTSPFRHCWDGEDPLPLSALLVCACERGDLEGVQDAASIGADIHSDVEEIGQRPINIACCNGHLHVVEWLNHEGVSLSARDGDGGGTALHAACRGGHIDVAQWVHQVSGALLDIVDDEGMQPLHHACEGGHLEVIQWLHGLGSSLDVVDGDKLTPLARAHYFAHKCFGGCDEFYRALVGSSDPTAKNFEQVLGWLANTMVVASYNSIALPLLITGPSGPPDMLGRWVKLKGLSGRVELNGEHGVAQSFNASNGRYGVLLIEKFYNQRLANGRRIMGEWVSVKRDNLTLRATAVARQQTNKLISEILAQRASGSVVTTVSDAVQQNETGVDKEEPVRPNFVDAAETTRQAASEADSSSAPGSTPKPGLHSPRDLVVYQADVGSDLSTASPSERLMRAKAIRAKRETAKAKGEGTATFLTAAELHEAEIKSAAAAAALLAEEVDVDAQTGLKKAKKKKKKKKDETGGTLRELDGSVLHSKTPMLEKGAEANCDALRGASIGDGGTTPSYRHQPVMLEGQQSPTSAPRPSQMTSDARQGGEAVMEGVQPALTLADVGNFTSHDDAPESTIGGQTTCIVCFLNPKTHLAAPCGHQCACGICAAKMEQCPYCRAPVQMWVQQRMV